MQKSHVLAVLLLAPALGVGAQDKFPGVEYVTGKEGFPGKFKGTLVLEPAAIKLLRESGQLAFEIPMSSVVSAKDSKEHEEGSFGRKMALGIFASKTEEFLQIDTKTATSAEAIVFKTKKKQSPGMAAKINFYREQVQKPGDAGALPSPPPKPSPSPDGGRHEGPR